VIRAGSGGLLQVIQAEHYQFSFQPVGGQLPRRCLEELDVDKVTVMGHSIGRAFAGQRVRARCIPCSKPRQALIIGAVPPESVSVQRLEDWKALGCWPIQSIDAWLQGGVGRRLEGIRAFRKSTYYVNTWEAWNYDRGVEMQAGMYARLKTRSLVALARGARSTDSELMVFTSRWCTSSASADCHAIAHW